MFEALADLVVFQWLGLDPQTNLGSGLHFFVYDLAKVGVLLVVVVHLMGLIKAWLPLEKVRDLMASGRFKGGEYPMASVFGAITPFCSCSSIPLFIGFLQAGIPLGVTFSFLITSPLVNEVAIALMWGLLGWKVTVLYVLAGMVLGTTLGWVLGRGAWEEEIEDWVQKLRENQDTSETPSTRAPTQSLWQEVHQEARTIIKQVGLYLIIGLGLAAGIHGFVPTEVLQNQLQAVGPLAVPAAVLLAVPLYAGAAGVVPVLEALIFKGVPVGTALAFMMGVVGLSFPEGMLLKKVLKPKLLGAFFGIVAAGIMVVGVLFNLIL